MNSTRLYQVFDTKAQLAVGPIMRSKSAIPPMRAFHTALADKDTELAAYPEDYILLNVGEQDEETAAINGGYPPIPIATGTAWLQSQQPRDK